MQWKWFEGIMRGRRVKQGEGGGGGRRGWKEKLGWMVKGERIEKLWDV